MNSCTNSLFAVSVVCFAIMDSPFFLLCTPGVLCVGRERYSDTRLRLFSRCRRGRGEVHARVGIDPTGDVVEHRYLAIGEVGHVPVEELCELEMRSVVGAREEDQLGVWQVLLQAVGIEGGE